MFCKHLVMNSKFLDLNLIYFILIVIIGYANSDQCTGNSKIENTTTLTHLNIFWVNVPIQKCFSFEIKINPYFMVRLANSIDFFHNKYILVSIGLFNNNVSGLLDSSTHNWEIKNIHTPDFINDQEYNGFWITWYKNWFKIGRNNDSEAFIEYKMQDNFEISFVGIENVSGKTGCIRIDNIYQCPRISARLEEPTTKNTETPMTEPTVEEFQTMAPLKYSRLLTTIKNTSSNKKISRDKNNEKENFQRLQRDLLKQIELNYEKFNETQRLNFLTKSYIELHLNEIKEINMQNVMVHNKLLSFSDYSIEDGFDDLFYKIKSIFHDLNALLNYEYNKLDKS